MITATQREVLESLARLAGARLQDKTFWRPHDFGGGDRTHHGLTAKRMADHREWVEVQNCKTIPGRRAAWRYRITKKGLRALENDALSRKLAGVA